MRQVLSEVADRQLPSSSRIARPPEGIALRELPGEVSQVKLELADIAKTLAARNAHREITLGFSWRPVSGRVIRDV